VFAVYDVARQSIDRARNGGGVTLIEAVTYRRKGHAEHDDQRYQSPQEIAEWERRDPITRYVDRLLADGTVQQRELTDIDQRVTSELDRAVAECENEPLPDPGTALSGVFANPESAAPLWFRRV
jgi:TPP-dependent pyruvate/acetoin dehydrogenase alpha subunit